MEKPGVGVEGQALGQTMSPEVGAGLGVSGTVPQVVIKEGEGE
jgi:hypothetical protein